MREDAIDKPGDIYQISKSNRRSTISNQMYEQWWYNNWFTNEFSEESSELSSESEKIDFNYWYIFQIISDQMEWNWPFNFLNNLVFDG